MFRRGERPPYRKVSPPVAFEILRDSPEILVLDLRSREEFLGDTGHVYTALNIPLEKLADRLVEIAPYRQDTFLVYCRGNDPCGEQGMAILVSSGFENPILIEGGMDGWIRSGFRTVLPDDAVGRSKPGRPPGEGGSLPPPR
jgi:rhodanese-related sulfurtransferase